MCKNILQVHVNLNLQLQVKQQHGFENPSQRFTGVKGNLQVEFTW
jgi:hypothetical protein